MPVRVKHLIQVIYGINFQFIFKIKQFERLANKLENIFSIFYTVLINNINDKY